METLGQTEGLGLLMEPTCTP